MIEAAMKGHKAVVEALLEAGADKDLQDEVRRLGACAHLPRRPDLTVLSPSPPL